MMKKILSVTVLVFAAFFLSANTIAESPVSVAKVEVFDLPAINPCNGEEILVNGTVIAVFRNHFDRQGRPHLSYRIQLMSLVGVGSYGNFYRVVGNVQQNLPQPLPDLWTTVFLPFEGDGPVVLRHNISNQLIPVGRSDAPKSMLHIRVNVTINANGELVVATGDADGEITCK